MIRAKTKRRLVILLVAAVAGSTLLGGAYVARRAYQRKQLFHARDVGLAAAKAGDYEAALNTLYLYCRAYPADPEPAYFYALSRQSVQDPNGGNLSDSIRLWRQYVNLKPDDLEARRRLLDLYVELSLNVETLDTAEAILTRVHDDPAALRAKAIAQSRLQHYADALQTIDHLNQIGEPDIDNLLSAVAIRTKNGATPAQLVAFAQGMLKGHANDPAFALLLSVTQAMAGDRAAAAATLKPILAGPAPSPGTLQVLLDQLNMLDMHEQSLAMARSAAAAHPGDLAYQRLLAARLFVAGDYAGVDNALKTLSASDPSADPQLLAFRGMSLAQQGRVSDARAFWAAAAATRKDHGDRLAAALASSAAAAWDDAAPAKDRVQACERALQADPKNAFLNYFLAQARSAQRDMDGALSAWQAAITAAPAWYLPFEHSARALVSAGRVGDALAAAQRAQTLAPNDQETLVAVALARAAALNDQDQGNDQARAAADLLTLVQNIRTRFPDAAEVRPLLVDLLARTGRTQEASAELRAALAQSPALPEAVLLQMAAISGNDKLDLETECFAVSEKAYGVTPPLAFARAQWLVGAGKPQDALHTFESAMPSGDAAGPWRLSYCRLLSACDDPRAKAAWIATAEAFPADVQIQWSALAARSVQDDHDFMGRTIQRLRSDLGAANEEVRLAQACWLLQESTNGKSVSEASVILSDVTHSAPYMVESRILLANCLQQMGNVSGAAEQFRIVAQVRPDDYAVALHLALLLNLAGDQAGARAQLDRIVRNAKSPSIQQQAAYLFLAVGDRDRAVQLMEKNPDASSVNSEIVLAQLYAEQNQLAKAQAICDTLLKAPTPDVIQFAASLLASQGRTADAQAVLAKLDAMTLAPGLRELIRADYLSRFGSIEDALAQFAAATRAAPHDVGVWRRLLMFCLGAGHEGDVKGVLVQALAANPAEANFAALRDRLPQLQTLAGNPAARELFLALLQCPADAVQPISQAIQVAGDRSKGAPAASAIKTLADSKPKILALQLFAAESLASAGDYESAHGYAMRAMAGFPNSPDAARVAAAVELQAGHFNEAVNFANQWRQRDGSQAMQVDVTLAAANVGLKQPDKSLHLLAPYLVRALDNPDRYSTILVINAQALLAAGQTGDALAQFSKWPSGDWWRGAALRMADSAAKPGARAAWLERVAAAIPADNSAQRLLLAGCYQQLAMDAHDDRYQQQARVLMDALQKRDDLDVGTLVSLGVLNESQKDAPDAEDVYRRALKADPNQPIAANNLAMLLLKSGKDLDQALDLSSRAVKAAPLPTFYDTQANIYAQKRKFDDALTSIGEALKREPANADWQVTRIVILAQSSRHDDATSEFQRLKSSGALEKLSDAARTRLAGVGLQ